MKLERINYAALNSRQNENYNFHKVSAVLADFGFVSIRLSDDWNGADFLAVHIGGETLKVQLKGRLTFDKKYLGKNIWICFRYEDIWYLYPHDELHKSFILGSTIELTRSWTVQSGYTFRYLSAAQKDKLAPYRLDG